VVPTTAALNTYTLHSSFSFLVEHNRLFISSIKFHFPWLAIHLPSRLRMSPKVVSSNTRGKFDLIVLVDVVKLKDVETLFSSAVGSCSITLLFALDSVTSRRPGLPRGGPS
jgi:hypothetical protein